MGSTPVSALEGIRTPNLLIRSFVVATRLGSGLRRPDLGLVSRTPHSGDRGGVRELVIARGIGPRHYVACCGEKKRAAPTGQGAPCELLLPMPMSHRAPRTDLGHSHVRAGQRTWLFTESVGDFARLTRRARDSCHASTRGLIALPAPLPPPGGIRQVAKLPFRGSHLLERSREMQLRCPFSWLWTRRSGERLVGRSSLG